MKTLLIAALLAVLAGCVSSGPKIEPGQLGEFRIGQTTANEVFKKFGRPNFASTNMDGSQYAVYVHAEDERGTSIAPVVGTLTGSIETVTFNFDEKGLLLNYKYSPASITPQTPAATAGTAPPAVAIIVDKNGTKTVPAVASAQNTDTKAAAGTAAGTEKPPGKSLPYLWEILRASKSSDPRNP